MRFEMRVPYFPGCRWHLSKPTFLYISTCLLTTASEVAVSRTCVLLQSLVCALAGDEPTALVHQNNTLTK